MKILCIFFAFLFAFIFNACYTTSEISNFNESKYIDSLKNGRIDYSKIESTKDTINSYNFAKLELKNKLLSIEDKIVSYHLIKASDSYRSALLVETLGLISSAVLTGVTYDRNKKQIKAYSFTPLGICTIIALVDIISASEHLSDAGMVKLKR